jgi:hypothetical protein
MTLADREVEFKHACESVSKLLTEFCPGDAALLLFASSLWLPNIASQAKHLLWANIFTSLKGSQFKNKTTINTYDSFRESIEKIHGLLPTFPELEDYIPECDWGNVRFHHKKADYKIFYGCEVGNIYDWLMSFQMLYCSIEDRFLECNERSPAIELGRCLELQNHIINGIASCSNKTAVSGISPGHLEVPSEQFWLQVRSFLDDYHPETQIDATFLNHYSIELGSVSVEFPPRPTNVQFVRIDLLEDFVEDVLTQYAQ